MRNSGEANHLSSAKSESVEDCSSSSSRQPDTELPALSIDYERLEGHVKRESQKKDRTEPFTRRYAEKLKYPTL